MPAITFDSPTADTAKPEVRSGAITFDDPPQMTRGAHAAAMVTDIPAKTGTAFSDAVGTMNRTLNPFSEDFRKDQDAHIKETQNAPWYDLGPSIDQVKRTGTGLAAIPQAAFSWVTGPARSVIGHGFEAIRPGISPEDKAKLEKAGIHDQTGDEVADTAMAGIAPRGASPVGPRMAPTRTPTAPDLKKAAVDVYQDPAIKSISVPASEAGNLAAGIEHELATAGFRPTTGSAPGTFAELKKLYPPEPAPVSQFETLQAEMNGLPPPTKTAPIHEVVVDDLRAARRALNMTAKQRDPFNVPTPDAVAARTAIEKIDGFLDTLAPELREANANYSAAKQAQQLDYRQIRAEHRAAKSGTGSNIENTMRQEVDKIPNRGLTAEQISARDQIVEGTVVRNALRKIGKLGISDGLSLLLHVGAAPASGGATVPIAVGGTVARKVGEALTRAEIAALSQWIRSDTPLAKMMRAKPQFLFTPRGAKAIGSLSVTQGMPRAPTFSSALPSYADEDQQ